MRHLALLFLASLFAAALPAQAQTGEDLLRYAQREPAVGPRLSGMAGAAVGGVGAWGGVYANPAGLGLLRRSEVSGALAGIVVEEEAAYFGETFDAETGTASLGSAAYAAKVPTRRGTLVFGIGYDQVAAYHREALFAGVNPDAVDPDGSAPLRQFGEVDEEGQRGRLTLAGAVEVAPRVLFGLGINLEAGTYEFLQLLDEEDAAGRLVFQTDDALSADLRGASLRAGLTAEVAPGVRLGAAVETPTVFRVEESFGLGTTSDGGFFDYTATTPWRLAAGLAYEEAGFLLTADVEYADWSEARLRPTDTFLPENVEVERDYREAIETRFGAEYDFGLGAVRAGAAFQPDPLRDVLEAERLRETYTLGASVRAGRATLDVAYLFTGFDDQLFPSEFYGAVDEGVRRHRFLAGARVAL